MWCQMVFPFPRFIAKGDAFVNAAQLGMNHRRHGSWRFQPGLIAQSIPISFLDFSASFDTVNFTCPSECDMLANPFVDWNRGTWVRYICKRQLVLDRQCLRRSQLRCQFAKVACPHELPKVKFEILTKVRILSAMKQLYWSLLFATSFGLGGQAVGQVFYEQNFDGLAVGDYIGSQESWMTWSDNPGSTEDAQVSSDFAASGQNSMHVFQTAQAGGPMDVVYVAGINSGAYDVSFKMYIPTGASGYYNFQETSTPGQAWAFDVVFANVGQFQITIDGAAAGTGEFPLDAWFEMKHSINLETDEMDMYIDGDMIGSFAYDGPEIGGINFFGFGDEIEFGNYYIDDLMVAEMDVESVEPVALHALAFNMGPNPAQDFVILSGDIDQAQVRVLALNGQLVSERQVNNLRQGERLSLNLNEGIYFVEVTQGTLRSIQRLVVQR